MYLYNKVYKFIFFFLNINISIKCYRFSVIISIYNSGRFLNDSIGSLLNQTIGFKSIQIILINDGSADDSENLCLKYKNKYKNNIFYAKISHGGVSKARNVGLNYAKGLYINFLDSDDKWDSKAFLHANNFFKFYQNINLICGRIKFFEAKNNYHLLDYKFKKTQIVNLTEEYSYIQLSVSSSFFRSSSIRGKKFQEGILFGEDIKFISNNLLIKPIIGILKEAIYYYRKRSDSTSAIQNTEENNNYYFKAIDNVQIYLLKKSIRLYNKIPPFIQFIVAYETVFRIKSKAFQFLNQTDYNKYCRIIETILKYIEDKYILEQKVFPSYLQIFALSKKYKNDLRYQVKLINDSFIYFSNYIMINFNKYKNIIIWIKMKIIGNILYLEGEDKCWLPREYFYYFCKLGNKVYYPHYYYYSGFDFVTMYGIVIKGRAICFDINLDINKIADLHFFISYKGKIIEIFPSLNSLIHIPPLKNSYYREII